MDDQSICTHYGTEEVWLCCGERNTGRICVVQTSKIGFDMTSTVFDVCITLTDSFE